MKAYNIHALQSTRASKYSTNVKSNPPTDWIKQDSISRQLRCNLITAAATSFARVVCFGGGGSGVEASPPPPKVNGIYRSRAEMQEGANLGLGETFLSPNRFQRLSSGDATTGFDLTVRMMPKTKLEMHENFQS